MLFAILLFFGVLIMGIVEQYIHNKRLKTFSIRVNVNGTRGKSTVTRLITGVLKEAGLKVVGKTTGTSARIIYWNKSDEKPIKRGLLGPNIIEQKKVIKHATELGANALVSECMAVNPDYQIVFQEKLVKANVGVIVNVREDHMDLCGPTLDFIAESFTATIPYNGHLVITPSKYAEYFIKEAEKRNTRTIIADELKIPEGYLNKFGYVIFPENVSIALAVAEALGIDKEIAFTGMLGANGDPGALMIYPLNPSDNTFFVNAFAANDPNSTLMIWDHIGSIGYDTKNPLVLLNCRPDRVDRTLQFVEDVLPNMQIDILAVMGESVKSVTNAVSKNQIKVNKYLNLEGMTPDEVYENIKEYFNDRIIYSVGNIHGGGEHIAELIIEHNWHEAIHLERQKNIGDPKIA